MKEARHEDPAGGAFGTPGRHPSPDAGLPEPGEPRSAGSPGSGVSSPLSALRRQLRVLRDDLWTFDADPLPPLSRPRLLRRAPHVVLCVLALVLSIGAANELSNSYNPLPALDVAIGFAQGGAVALALWRPLPAWWLSLAAHLVASQIGRMATFHLHGFLVEPPPWPWTGSAITSCAVVLFLLALRVPTRVAAGVWAVTALVTFCIQGVEGAAFYSGTGLPALVVFGLVLLVGTALRGRREARTQLVELTVVTAEERARRTLLEERNRIARELHDVVAHHMSVISIQAQVAPHLVENPSAELRENLDGIRKNALEALTELRRVLGVLRSENPADPYGIGSGTGAAPDSPQPTLDRLDALVENTRAAGMEVRTEIVGEVRPLSPGVELSAYRIVQEALSNALRHAPGSTVRVELTYFPRGLQLHIANSRPTRPVPPSPGAGHGLLGMRERAVMLGGTLFATGTACGGFAVACFLPSPEDAPPDGAPADPTGEENR
ncbi:sensor histidine kinase [Streptomyces sp. NPDC003758]|uniref:histidine kinase n=1 Tax=Streptomyces cynarae TaxID=2981134 RepID=A0ABY6E359_9ACTN|nr:sensor histidine kinase [Streptomyces cynarae]UXY21052.1 sensor histidine kinase [Streptomyces cynarae]